MQKARRQLSQPNIHHVLRAGEEEDPCSSLCMNMGCFHKLIGGPHSQDCSTSKLRSMLSSPIHGHYMFFRLSLQLVSFGSFKSLGMRGMRL